jgi:hypothetical protein
VNTFVRRNCIAQNAAIGLISNGVVSYFHRAIFPVIVAPRPENVLALAPEFITPQDGYEKQDCEQTAAKRWLKVYGGEFLKADVIDLSENRQHEISQREEAYGLNKYSS